MRPAWPSILALLLGASAVLLLLLSDRLRQRSVVEDTLALRSCESIRVDLAISHLWLEEYVSGDRIEPGVIDHHLQSAISHLDRLSGVTSGGPRTGNTTPALHENALRRQAAALRPPLEAFRALSQERQEGFAKALPVGIGSALDIEYDQAFADLLQGAQRLEAAVLEHGDRHRADTQRVFRLIVILWCVFVLVVATVLWLRQRRQHRTDMALSASRAQLTHSQRMDAAGRLAGGLAHDLSNYLAAIRGHCELAQLKSPGDSMVARKMQRVLQTVDRASYLVNGLLDYGRRQPVPATEVHLGPLLKNTAKMLEPSMGERIRLEVSIPPSLWPVQLDAVGLEQTLVNLLVNARDAMPDGGVIELTAHNILPEDDIPPGDEAAPMVRLTVRDQGVGIPQSHQSMIFEPFWTTKQSSGGSGLGLSTVAAFVEQHGGRLEMHSSQGATNRGTTFELLFPALSIGVEELEGTGLEDTADLEDLLDGDLEGEERILLVDDNDALRHAASEVLEALGYRVTEAASGAEALRASQHAPQDAWIIDWVLPDMDGGQLLESLRQTTGQTLPILVISGHSRERLGTGFDDFKGSIAPRFLPKHDLSPLLLARHLRRLLDGEPDDAEHPSPDA